MGSPRKTGNTISITQPFIDELKAGGQDVELVWLYDRDIQPCKACRVCQTDWTAFGCQYQDDVQEIFDKILESDVIVFATPIYSWFCTPPMKSLLDRLVYGMDKFYGEAAPLISSHLKKDGFRKRSLSTPRFRKPSFYQSFLIYISFLYIFLNPLNFHMREMMLQH